MRRFLTYYGVVGILILLQTATVVVSLDKADFSDKFRKLVENILGIHPYEVIASFIHFLGSVHQLHIIINPYSLQWQKSNDM